MIRLVDDTTHKDTTIDILARTMWGTAKEPTIALMEAVGCVVRNRVKIAQQRGGYWWGNDFVSVCQKPYQFNCWNRSDPAYRELIAVDKTDLYFAHAVIIADMLYGDRLADITGGATHFHPIDVKPERATGQQATCIFDGFKFYKLLG